jgi:hypothetical protein
VEAREPPKAPGDIALERCEHSIRYFERNKEFARWGWIICQGGAIVFAGLTPILILWTDVPKAIQALPAALAGILAGLVAVFGYPENKGRWAEAIAALEGERVKYLTRTTPVQGTPNPTDEELLKAFVTNVEAIVMTTTREWRRALQDRLRKDAGQT